MKIGVDFSFWPPQREGIWRRGGLIVSALDSGSGGPGSSPGRGYCVVFLVKASLTIN